MFIKFSVDVFISSKSKALSALLVCMLMSLALTAQRNRLPRPFDFDVDSSKVHFVNFVGDSTATSAWSEAHNRSLDSQFQLKDDFTFQFRMREYFSLSNSDDVFVLTLKDSKWNARFFEQKPGAAGASSFVEKLVDQSAVDQLWQLLLDNQVLTLSPQSMLAEKLVKYVIDTADLPYVEYHRMVLTDGVGYEFTLSAPGKERHYFYHSPQTFLNQYGNVKELSQVVMMVTLIKKFLGLPLFVD